MAGKPAALVAVLALLALVLPEPALAQGAGGIAPPEPSTDSGEAIKQVYWVVFALTAFVFVAVETTLILFIVRYRRRRGTPAGVEGPQVHGNTRVEIIWTLVPALLLLALAVFTFVRIPAVEANPDGADGRNALRIRVDAHQFYWQYRYPGGALSFDTLYLPVDRTVTLELDALDVAHSWWVPELTGKRDAIPGQINELSFKPTKTGTFANGKCAEFCGVQHALMLTKVEVLSQKDFDRWVEDNAPADARSAQLALGRAEWEAACAKCHGLEGEGDVGPAIAGNGTLTARSGLRRLLLQGQDLEDNEGYMPPVGRGWESRQLDALIAYIKSEPKLSGEEESGGG